MFFNVRALDLIAPLESNETINIKAPHDTTYHFYKYKSAKDDKNNSSFWNMTIVIFELR